MFLDLLLIFDSPFSICLKEEGFSEIVSRFAVIVSMSFPAFLRSSILGSVGSNSLFLLAFFVISKLYT